MAARASIRWLGYARRNCELNNADPFDYLTELQKHAEELAKTPAAWMPRSHRQTLQQAGPSEAPA
jgi:hypothetical protein